MILYMFELDDENDVISNPVYVNMTEVVDIIASQSNIPHLNIESIIKEGGVGYWYDLDYTHKFCVLDINRHTFKNDYDKNIYMKLKLLIREEKLNTLGI